MIMKRILLMLFFCIPFTTYAYVVDYCSNACAANCDYWELLYEVDSDCKVTSYQSWHWTGGNVEYNNDLINPGYLGMDVRNLGCDCENVV